MDLAIKHTIEDKRWYGHWSGLLPNETPRIFSMWDWGYRATTNLGATVAMVDFDFAIKSGKAKKIIAAVLGERYLLLSAKEIKLVDATMSMGDRKLAKLLLSKYRGLGILRHKFLTESIPAKYAPVTPRYFGLTPTPPEKLMAPPKRLFVESRNDRFSPMCIAPIFNRVGNDYGFAYEVQPKWWERAEIAPMYIVTKAKAGKPHFSIFWTRGSEDLKLNYVCKTTREYKILELIQTHFTKCMLENTGVAEVFGTKYVKIVPAKCSTKEILQEIDRLRHDLRVEANRSFDGEGLKLVLKLMGKEK